MENLSHLAQDSVWSTSQHAGNRPSDASVAMTAPGSASPSVDESATSPAGGGGDISDQPFVKSTSYDTPVLIGPGGSKRTADRADRGDPYSEDDGAGWHRAPKQSWEPS
jgi:hypothetical protein